MMKHINIILADDHKMVREGLKSIIEKQPDMKIIAEASKAFLRYRYQNNIIRTS